MEVKANKMATMKMVPLVYSMALPAMISMLINALYNIVDSIFVAKYSADALTAVSFVFPLQQLVIAIAVGTGVGVNSLIARRLGAKMQEEAESAAEHGLVLSIISGIVFIIIGLFLSKPFLQLFTDKPSILGQAIDYSKIAVGMSIFVMISVMCEKIQQSTGNMMLPMMQGLTGAIINIILDPLMIFGIGPFPEMGIKGAALATVIGQFFGMCIGVWGVTMHQKILKLRLKSFRWSFKTALNIYQVGLPGIIMQSISSVMISGMNVILVGFSDVAVSVLGIYFKLQTFIFMPVFGINQGALPVMGYSYGARNRKRLMSAYKVAVSGAIVIMLLGTVIFQLFPEQMLMMFADTKNANATKELLEIGVPALKTISISFVAAAFGIINSTVFQAVGRGMASLIVSVCRQLIGILPTAWALGKFFTLSTLWFAFPISEVFALIVSFALFYYAHRVDLRYLDEPKNHQQTV